MSEFNFKSSICTSRSQSERLLTLGLKKETADIRGVEGIEHTPTYAWSLHRLLCLYNCHYLEFMGEEEIASVYDVVIEAIERAITGGYFNEKYLE